MGTFSKALESWDHFLPKPYYFFYYYVPKRYEDLTDESEEIQEGIWDFKSGTNQNFFIDQIETKIRHTFENPSDLTLFCIPAATAVRNRMRYKEFSDILCKRLNMVDGYDHVTISKDTTPTHLRDKTVSDQSGDDNGEVRIEFSFFKGKKVVLFDDVVTKGHSMKTYIELFEKHGVEVVCCMSLGRTFWDRTMDYTVNHPWTGGAVFDVGSRCEPDKDNYDQSGKPVLGMPEIDFSLLVL